MVNGLQRSPHCNFECFVSGRGDRLRGRQGQRVANEFDRFADDIGEPRGKARVFQGLNGASERRQVGLCHIRPRQDRLRLLRHQPASPDLPRAA